MWLQVAPRTASSGSAGVRSSSCLEVRILSALPTVFKFRVAPQLYFARRASRCITGCPAFASSGPAGDRSSGCPDSRILQRLCCVSVGLPRRLALPVAPADVVTGLPRFLHLPALPATDLRVTPNLAFSVPTVLELSVALELRSSGCSSRCRRGFPHLLHPPAWPQV